MRNVTKKYTPEELKLRMQYSTQKGNSIKRRNIPFTITYEEWKEVWVSSGHLHEKGRKKGQYCMSRYGDVGPYSKDNVFIQLHSVNAAEGHTGIPNGPSKLKGTKKTEPSKLKGRPSGKKGQPWSEARKAAQKGKLYGKQ